MPDYTLCCDRCKWSYSDSLDGHLKCRRFDILIMPSVTCGSGELPIFIGYVEEEKN